MADVSELVMQLKQASQQSEDPKLRESLMLDVLRRSLDRLDRTEAFAKLAAARAALAPPHEDGEGKQLWDTLTTLGPPKPRAKPHEASGQDLEGLDRVADALLGDRRGREQEIDAAASRRLCDVLTLLADMLNRYDNELRRLKVQMRRLHGRPVSENDGGGTLVDLMQERSLRSLMKEVISGEGDLSELEDRLQSMLRTTVALHQAHEVSVEKACEAIRSHIEPNEFQQKHKGDAWREYRRVFTSELWKFGPNFRLEFVQPHFVEEFLRSMMD